MYSGRALYWMTSAGGREWSEPQRLAFALQGHYQISWPWGDRLGTAFNLHPPPLGLNERTNLYYLETRNMGRTWVTIDGKTVPTPMTKEDSPALVRNYRDEKLLVYLKDLQYEEDGKPVIVFLTSRGYRSGPEKDPRILHTARWTGTEWKILPIIRTDHNYDYGSLYIGPDGQWRFIGPTGPGPQPYGTGGEIEIWTSEDKGQSWRRVRQLTRNSRFNHTYVRRPLNAHPDFYALWADGDAFGPSESSLYFTNKTGDHVWKLPPQMRADHQKPQPVF
jgi:hypothetical protein